jgi:ribosomal protein S18 acetylase RimI-like enzyme
VRILGPGDESEALDFLDRRPDTTLFLQSNLRQGGLVDRGEVFQATWAAAFEDGAIAGIAAHCWNGNVVVEAETALADVVRAAADASRRGVNGILGARAQVEAARTALGLDTATAYMDSTEDLFALSLDRLRVPAPLASGAWEVRAPHDDEIETLIAWRYAYRTETLGESPGEALRAKCAEEIPRYQRDQVHFVLAIDGAPAAYSAFNASTPSCVQIGGVWTPHALRSRGHARAVVGGSLLEAQRRGVTRSVLFTETDNHAAQAAYRAIGYERVGDYGMVLFS